MGYDAARGDGTATGGGTASGGDLPPRPEPDTEEREPNPGGPDAVDRVNSGEEPEETERLGRDLGADHHPARDDLPEEVRGQEGERETQQPGPDDVTPEDEDPA